MSKWINKDLFEDFQKEKIEEKDTSTGGFRRSEMLWETPAKGTVEQPKVYEGRFVPDPKGKFYKRYYYHFWKTGETWTFVLCPKTDDFKNFCPFCSATAKLYSGSQQDKSQGYNLKRKEKFVGNFYVAKDSRDSDRDEEKQVIGKIKLYEFPSQVEKKLKNEITDRDEGYGLQIFDPSENGRNLILKVLSTKKQEDGKQWPDYSSSTFSRSQSALGSDDEIDAMMQTCTDLEEYVNSMAMSLQKQVEVMKNEFIWELVEKECLKNGYEDIEIDPKPKDEAKSEDKSKDEAKSEEDPDWDTGKKEEKKEEEKKEEKKKEEKPADSGNEIDDDDLLAELDAM
jgi:hypothetical protein